MSVSSSIPSSPLTPPQAFYDDTDLAADSMELDTDENPPLKMPSADVQSILQSPIPRFPYHPLSRSTAIKLSRSGKAVHVSDPDWNGTWYSTDILNSLPSEEGIKTASQCVSLYAKGLGEVAIAEVVEWVDDEADVSRLTDLNVLLPVLSIATAILKKSATPAATNYRLVVKPQFSNKIHTGTDAPLRNDWAILLVPGRGPQVIRYRRKWFSPWEDSVKIGSVAPDGLPVQYILAGVEDKKTDIIVRTKWDVAAGSLMSRGAKRLVAQAATYAVRHNVTHMFLNDLAGTIVLRFIGHQHNPVAITEADRPQAIQLQVLDNSGLSSFRSGLLGILLQGMLLAGATDLPSV